MGVVLLCIDCYCYNCLISLLSQSEGEGSDAELALCSSGERVLLQRTSNIEADKNSDVMKALVRANPSYATSTISSLLGGARDDTCKSHVRVH